MIQGASCALALLFCLAPTASAQNTALQRAREAFDAAQKMELQLNDKARAQRTRNEIVRLIEAYQRVYIITPHTGYADNALMTIARLYEEIQETPAAVRTLKFLVREYPGTPFKDAAERDLARLGGAPAVKSGSASVENIRFWEEGDSVRVVVDLSAEVRFSQGEAKNPNRVFIDIGAARLNALLAGKQWPVTSDLLQQIRVGQYNASTVRIVLDGATLERVSSFTLDEPNRLVIDLAKTAEPTAVSKVEPTPAAPSTATAPAAENKPAPPPAAAPAEPALAVTEEARIATAAKPTNNGDHSLIRALGLKLRRVVIDAGHGGHDTGTIGPGGLTEKEVVLDVSRRLKEMIEKELGAEVVMTRENDSFVPLESRTAIANRVQADLFISVHANSSRVREVRGVETYFFNITSSRDAAETVSRENAASERSIHELQDLVQKMVLQDKVDESRELAEYVQKSLAARKDAGPNRGVKQAPFVVLMGASMPSILAEICFISNPQEEKLVRTPEYRQRIAESLFEGVRSYSESLSGLKTVNPKILDEE